MDERKSLQFQRTDFFKLSQELRDQVYGHVFQTHEEPIAEPYQFNNLTKIFALNRQIYQETHALFYSKYYSSLVFDFTFVEKLLSMVRSIGWHHRDFTGRLRLHHIYEPFSSIDPGSLTIYDNSNAIWHVTNHFGIGIWRPNSDDGDGCREKFKDNPFVVDTEQFFSKGCPGDLNSVEAEVVAGGSEGRVEPSNSFGRGVWNSGPKWSVSVKYAYLEHELSRGRYIGKALEVEGDLGVSMRTLFSTPALSKRRV
jgi:hypothetical protein